MKLSAVRPYMILCLLFTGSLSLSLLSQGIVGDYLDKLGDFLKRTAK